MTKDEVYWFLCDKAEYALNSRSIYLMYEAYGAAKMARKLSAITQDQFIALNEKLVRNGINNPRSYDD